LIKSNRIIFQFVFSKILKSFSKIFHVSAALVPRDFTTVLSLGVSGYPLKKSFAPARFIYLQKSPRDGRQKGAAAFISSRTGANLCTDRTDHCRWQIASLRSRRVAPMRNYPVACGAVLKHLSNDAFPYTRVAWPYTRSSLVHNSVPMYTSRCLLP